MVEGPRRGTGGRGWEPRGLKVPIVGVDVTPATISNPITHDPQRERDRQFPGPSFRSPRTDDAVRRQSLHDPTVLPGPRVTGATRFGSESMSSGSTSGSRLGEVLSLSTSRASQSYYFTESVSTHRSGEVTGL